MIHRFYGREKRVISRDRKLSSDDIESSCAESSKLRSPLWTNNKVSKGNSLTDLIAQAKLSLLCFFEEKIKTFPTFLQIFSLLPNIVCVHENCLQISLRWNFHCVRVWELVRISASLSPSRPIFDLRKIFGKNHLRTKQDSVYQLTFLHEEQAFFWRKFPANLITKWCEKSFLVGWNGKVLEEEGKEITNQTHNGRGKSIKAYRKMVFMR